MKAKMIKKLVLGIAMVAALSGVCTGCGEVYDDDYANEADQGDVADNNTDGSDDEDGASASDFNDVAYETFAKYNFTESDEAPSAEDMEILYNNTVSVDTELSDFFHVWSRTECSSRRVGTINITVVDDKTAHVDGEFYFDDEVGDIDADGYFINAYNLFVEDKETNTVYFFTVFGDEMKVTQHGVGCMGACVDANGEYTTGTPNYVSE